MAFKDYFGGLVHIGIIVPFCNKGSVKLNGGVQMKKEEKDEKQDIMIPEDPRVGSQEIESTYTCDCNKLVFPWGIDGLLKCSRCGTLYRRTVEGDYEKVRFGKMKGVLGLFKRG